MWPACASLHGERTRDYFKEDDMDYTILVCVMLAAVVLLPVLERALRVR